MKNCGRDSTLMKSCLVLAITAAFALLGFGDFQPPPPPPQPAVGQLGGPIAGLTTGQSTLNVAGYGDFNIKWDPIRGLGPVFTKTGCQNCHGSVDQVGTLNGIAGDASPVV